MIFCIILFLRFNEQFVSTSEPVAYQIFKKPGELMIGGLFPFHTEVIDFENHWKPEPLKCSSWNPTGFLQALAMKFALEEINNSTTLLPGETLGYEIYDTCLNSLVILHPVLLFLAKNGTEDVEVSCNLTEYRTRVLAVIGPSSTEVATVAMKMFSTFLIPQISYSVTADLFSDKSVYPTFYRTVPSDKKQVYGMVTLMTFFKWNWIAAVASEDNYGETALQQLSASGMSSGICIAYEGLIPTYLSTSETIAVIEDILYRIEQTDVKVVLVFASLTQSVALFKEVIVRNMTRVWIGSASWVLSQSILSLPGIERVGTIIGFFPNAHTVLGFDEFLRTTISQYLQQVNGGYQSIALDPDKIPIMLNPLTALHAHSVYTAVYAVAYALHKLLNCTSVKCNKEDSKIYAWKLLEQVKNVDFSIFNISFKFDSNGNPNTGYDIVTHSMSGIGFTKIGSYNQDMELNRTLINWGTPMNMVPESQCSGDCLQGQVRRVKGTHSCCFDCIDCQEGMFQSIEDEYQCQPCPVGQWSNVRSTSCSIPTYMYLQWSHLSVIFLLLLSFVLLCLVLGTIILFFQHRHSPLVRASGGHMCSFTLLSLLAVNLSIILFIGKPADLVCQLQQPLPAMGFTCCLSTFSIKALQVMLVTDFKDVPTKYIQWLKTIGTWVFVIFSIVIQGLFCTWYMLTAPSLYQNEQVTFLYKYLKCEITNVFCFFLMFGYNGILALISFMLNCVAQAPPGQYNLARDITFSALAYLLIWIVFVPVYAEVTDGNQLLLQMIVTLLSSLASLSTGCGYPLAANMSWRALASLKKASSLEQFLRAQSFNQYEFMALLAMKFTVGEINNSSNILPNVSLGYEIYDTCHDVKVIQRAALMFLTEGNDSVVQVLCNYTDYKPKVVAVVGPSTSDMVMATGKMFSFFHLPQNT
ncbi:taste receptor type 1 member 3-like [Bufo gargarizans]|uniref:taste receptor type 1 member 3-like n=1 Tax=Bufo gargarizans TaxID=30331 RepID=UPI001CF379B0|nr:taste receptor type 1 member 3-like [Bufo gargarizans]